MLRFYYNPTYKYTNRLLISVDDDNNYKDIDYENIDSPDTINGHIIYTLSAAESIPTYLIDLETGRRYFVSGITQLRTGKFQISLLRDILSESLIWSTERAYIEAGTAPEGDYCRYKKWGLPFTNTKVGQQRLDIHGKSSFFVFYVNQQTIEGDNISEEDLKLNYTNLPNATTYDIELNNLNQIPFFEYVGAGQIRSWSNVKSTLWLSNASVTGFLGLGAGQKSVVYDNQNYFDKYNLSFADSWTGGTKRSLYTNVPISKIISNTANTRASMSNAIRSFTTNYQASLGNYVAQTTINSLDEYVNKVIRIPKENDPTNFDFYKISLKRNVINHNDFLTNSQTTSLTNMFKQISSFDNLLTPTYPPERATWTNEDDGHFYFNSTENLSTYTLEFLGTATNFEFNFKSNIRKLPKSAVRCVNIIPDEVIGEQLLQQALMLAMANPLAIDDNIGRIVDIQYLPFSLAENANENFKFGSHVMTAEFVDNDDFIYTTNLEDLKNINKETDSVVIVSPSRKSQFKFSPYNNNGNMEFDTKITIKPYQSIIYVRPSTKGLLLFDWDDKDCLIIQEDFSLTAITSQWANYVYNNRNYQNTFNLQLQTKEYEREWERRIEREQAKSDNWTARNISSQKAQSYTGNLPIISNIAGAIGTAWQDSQYMQAAQLDREYNEALYQKGIEVSKQMFEYQLDNVKAQPLIPNNLTSIDVKLLDGIYLEFYSTNETEIESIQMFYQNNGNRIDNYGTFENYWGGFIRGKIIRSSHYTQPEIDEANRRLEMGIYTGVNEL